MYILSETAKLPIFVSQPNLLCIDPIELLLQCHTVPYSVHFDIVLPGHDLSTPFHINQKI
jgi:hypothetical protein